LPGICVETRGSSSSSSVESKFGKLNVCVSN
jgi:hypothetical protein